MTNPYFQLTPDMRINRLINGLWQVSGAHGAINPAHAIQDMVAYHQANFKTWDLADHYGPAEDFVGTFRQQLSPEALNDSYFFTKWVPRPMMMHRGVVEQAIDESRRRMRMEQLDLLQFHWWEYRDTRFLDAMKHLQDLCTSGKIKHLGLTNFDTQHTAQIVDAGVRIVSNQVQFSVIDRRPEVKMIPYCQAQNIALLTYGTYCGGFLTEKYLNAPEPTRSGLTTASLRKYKTMIDTWGGWTLFQEMLRTLKAIADKHHVSLANVAVRFVLEKPMVAGVIVGARLGIEEHRAENIQALNFHLDTEDLAQIDAVSARGTNLMDTIGDCGDEYRQ